MADKSTENGIRTETKWVTEKYLVSLLRAALRDEPPMPAPKGLNWGKLFSIAERHLVASAVYNVVKKEGSCPEDVLKNWHLKAETALRKELLFDVERQQILDIFDKEGIDYLPLKGILIKDLYPHKGMRQFADNDILYRKENREKVIQIMRGRGYEMEEFSEESVHDAFMKNPVYNFEMHRDLFEEHIPYTDYFADVWDKAVKLTDERREYRMTNEDFYVYVQAHCYKHYAGNGTGIRSFADLYLIRKSLSFDEEVLQEKLEKVGIVEFDKESRYIADCFFGDNPKDLDDRTFEYVIMGGVYGSVESGIENDFYNEGKAVSLWRMIFPTMHRMKQIFPVLNKAPVLLPILYVARWIGALFNVRKLKKGFIFLKKLFSPKLRKQAKPLAGQNERESESNQAVEAPQKRAEKEEQEE